MAPHYTDSLEDAFPLLRQKRQLEEDMTKAKIAAELEEAKKITAGNRSTMIEYIKAEKPKSKKRFMTMSDIPQEDMFGNLHAHTDEENEEASPPYTGVGRRLKDGRPFMYTAFYDGHELTLAVVGCALAVFILGLRQMMAIATLHKYVHQLQEVIERQHHEVLLHMRSRHVEQHQAHFAMPRFA
jgi:hypothetical protein